MIAISASEKAESSRKTVSVALTARSLLRAAGAGLMLTASFPMAVPAFGAAPLLDWGPRELFILPAAAYFYAQGLRGAFRGAWVAGFAHFLTLLFWLYVAMNEFGRMPWYQAIPALSLLAAYCSLYLAALPPLFAILLRRVRLPAPLLFGISVVFLEWLRSHALTGFPWGLWGYSQARNLPLANLSAWGGVYLVSAAVAVLGALAFEVGRARGGRHLVVLAATTALLHGAGALRLALDREESGVEPISVALLQGNIRQEVKNRGVLAGARVAAVYEELARQALDADLLLWPESAWPYALDLDSPWFPVERDVPMVVGVVQGQGRGTEQVAHNSSVYVEPGGRIGGRQHKLHLVPFGEYVPLRWLLPVDRVVPGLIDFTPGTGAHPVGAERIGVLICYDGIFPDIGRAHAAAGAEILANLTNDAWYGRTSGPLHHLDFYVFRAIETGRYVLRATNTGYSAVIRPTGEVTARTELDRRTVSRGLAYRRQGTTLYVWAGDWVVAVAVAAVVAAALAAARDRLTGRRSPAHFPRRIETHEGDDDGTQ